MSAEANTTAKAGPPCPCDLQLPYIDCCGRYHQGALQYRAPDAAALMRSRYSAYVLGLSDYLQKTWHASTRPVLLQNPEPGLRWLGLQVKAHQRQSENSATVHFVARSKLGGRAQRLDETSRFALDEGRWFYVDGDIA